MPGTFSAFPPTRQADGQDQRQAGDGRGGEERGGREVGGGIQESISQAGESLSLRAFLPAKRFELCDPHGLIGEAGNDFELAAHRFDEAAQGT